MERCEEIKFVEVVEDEYLGNVNLHRLHPYVKYVASKTIPTQFVTNFPSRLSMHHPNLFFYVKRAHSSNLNAHQFNIFFEYNYQSLESVTNSRQTSFPHHFLACFNSLDDKSSPRGRMALPGDGAVDDHQRGVQWNEVLDGSRDSPRRVKEDNCVLRRRVSALPSL